MNLYVDVITSGFTPMWRKGIGGMGLNDLVNTSKLCFSENTKKIVKKLFFFL